MSEKVSKTSETAVESQKQERKLPYLEKKMYAAVLQASESVQGGGEFWSSCNEAGKKYGVKPSQVAHYVNLNLDLEAPTKTEKAGETKDSVAPAKAEGATSHPEQDKKTPVKGYNKALYGAIMSAENMIKDGIAFKPAVYKAAQDRSNEGVKTYAVAYAVGERANMSKEVVNAIMRQPYHSKEVEAAAQDFLSKLKAPTEPRKEQADVARSKGQER